jgi:hypothetical protein
LKFKNSLAFSFVLWKFRAASFHNAWSSIL